MITNEISTNNSDQLLKRAFYTIKQLQAENAANNDPIAVIGMSCRFPGGCNTPEKFWELIKQGKSGIKEVPLDRFSLDEYYDETPGSQGKMYVREAGFLEDDVAAFDARFFNLSPREVSELDPQQRILLELSWEALERAGLTVPRLKNSRSGVFIGLISSEYAMLPRNKESIGPYTSTGILSNLASGRIAHFFGFRGPAITLDTACSSSLVSAHLACESLRRKECDLALAGGINLMLSPLSFIMLCKLNALAKDGRCKSFDANADGYGRGEGGGIIVLKRLSDAQRDNDTILAVIKGSAVNHDGSSSGLTVPNGLAQEELIRNALAKAKMRSEDIDYLEAHGTGTPLGDPIELQAINQVFNNENRAKKPLYIGTVKANIGHLEAAAGIAGIIKAILCLQHKIIPPHFPLKKLNPRINLQTIPIIVPDKETTWHVNGKTRAVGISSFGFSGTNAHAILQEYALPESDIVKIPVQKDDRLYIFTISSFDKNTLTQLINDYSNYLNKYPEVALADICYSANTGRTHFPCRIAFLVKDKKELQKELANFIYHDNAMLENHPKTAFIFGNTISINKDDYLSLYISQPIFREHLEHCSELFKSRTGWSLIENLKDKELQIIYPSHLMISTFSIEYALYKMWDSLNIKPSAIIAEGTGIYTAACVSEMITLEKTIEHIIKIGKERDSGKEVNQISIIHHANDFFQPKISILASVTGEFIKKSVIMTSTFIENEFSGSIQIERCIKSLCGKSYKFLIGFGVENKLVNCVNTCIKESENCDISYFEGENSSDDLLKQLVKMYCMGADLNWQALYKDTICKKVPLPTYPFQKKRYWLDSYIDSTGPIIEKVNNLDGTVISSPLTNKQVLFEFNLQNYPALKDTHDTVHVGYYQEMIKCSMKKIFKTYDYAIIKLNFHSALIVSQDSCKTVSLILEPMKDNKSTLKIYSLDREEMPWVLHVDGLVMLGKLAETTWVSESIELIKGRCNKLISGIDFYQGMQNRGVILGESVQWIDSIWTGKNEALASFKQLSKRKANSLGFELPIDIWDSCAQIFNACISEHINKKYVFMVTQWSGISFNRNVARDELWCHIIFNYNHKQGMVINGSFKIINGKDEIIAQCESCEMKAVDVERMKMLRKDANKFVSQNDNILAKLRFITKNDQVSVLEDYLKKVVASVLQTPVEDFHAHESLRHLGIDSLSGLDLKTKLYVDLKIDVPVAIIIEGHSINELVQIILELLFKENNGVDLLSDEVDHIPKKSSWFNIEKNIESTKLQLFCLPYGGGGASLYEKWKNKVPSNIAIVPIQLPGRENRINEKPIDNIDDMVQALENAFSLMPKISFAIYGHSAGALIAFRLAQRLRESKKYNDNIKHLLIGGYTSPYLQPNPFYQTLLSRFNEMGFDGMPCAGDIDKYSSEQLLSLLNMTGIRVQSGIEQEMARTFLPAILSDLRIIGEYKYINDHIIDIPITAFHGKRDDRVVLGGIKAWGKLTKSDFNFHVLNGDHFFLNSDQSQDKLIELIVQQLKQYVET